MRQKQIYFIVGGYATKIGVSSDPHRRMGAFQVGSPVPLSLTYCTPGGSALERKIWELLHPRRMHGEWFEGEIYEPEAVQIVAAASENRLRGVPAREAYERAGGVRPSCACHGYPMRWTMSATRRGGGYWRCDLK